MRIPPCLFLAALFGVVMSLTAGCGKGEEVAGPGSAILITLDTVRADALGCYGGREGITPHLDALAAEGIRFDRAHTVTPLTLPAHASMLTGLYPPRHGLRNNGERALPPSAATLAELARDAGFATAAIIASVVLDGAFGLEQGFEHYDSPPHQLEQATTEYAERPAADIVARTTAWIRARDRERRFFLWVHLWDAHGPWNPPPEFLRRAPDHPYLGDVAIVDAAVGELVALFASEGVLDEATLLVVGDHGEAFWEHGEFSHGAYCYQTTMRVPLLLRYADEHGAGEVSDAVVSVADVLPTLAEAMGLRVPSGIDGTSLYRREIPADRGVYLESYYGYLAYEWSPLWGWVDAEAKFLQSSETHLFDLDADPEELRNLAATRSDELDRYRAAIAEVASRPPLVAENDAGPDAALREKIGDLGYAVSAVETRELPPPLATTNLPSPASRVEERKQVLAAQDHFNAGRYPEAEAIHRALLAENPRHHHALERLGICLIRQRRFLEAIEPLERVMADERGTASAAVNLGTCLRVAERNDRALHWFERALEIDASQIRAVRHLIDLYGARGDEEAVRRYEARFRELSGLDAAAEPAPEPVVERVR